MGDLFGKAFYIFFSIPTMVIITILAILLPSEPRFKNENDCYWHAIIKASDECDYLRKRSEDPLYFNYKKCYDEHYNMYFRQALREYDNPPELKGDIFTKLTYSQLGVLVWICLGLGTIITFIRFFDEDKRWWWFLPDKKYINRPNYRHYEL